MEARSMAEIIMTFALGFLIASAIALTLAAPLWRRAASVTEKRLRASSPVSLVDFNADKDRMRAEFAMSARKLEMSVENLRKKAETRLAELDRRERQVAALKEEIEEKSGSETRQSEEIAVFRQRLADAESGLKRRDEELAELRARLGEAQNVLARQAVAIREANSLVEGHRSDIDVLTRGVDSRTEELTKKAAELEQRDGELEKCGRAVAEQKMIVGEMKRERVAHTRRIAELESERDAAHAALRDAGTQIAALKAQSRDLASKDGIVAGAAPLSLAERIRALGGISTH
jgi:chromosome segregation ATPase